MPSFHWFPSQTVVGRAMYLWFNEYFLARYLNTSSSSVSDSLGLWANSDPGKFSYGYVATIPPVKNLHTIRKNLHNWLKLIEINLVVFHILYLAESKNLCDSSQLRIERVSGCIGSRWQKNLSGKFWLRSKLLELFEPMRLVQLSWRTRRLVSGFIWTSTWTRVVSSISVIRESLSGLVTSSFMKRMRTSPICNSFPWTFP